jgi:hypothetical protein
MKKCIFGAASVVLIAITSSCSSESPTSTEALADETNEAATNKVPIDSKRSANSGSGMEQGYLCNPARCRNVGPLEAKGVQEARWLIENGYPTEDEAKRLGMLGTAQLKAEADAGNRAAQVFYGKHVALESNFLSGLSILRQAAQSGSLYAYHGISEAYLDEVRSDRINSYAYLRLAYILGDSRAAGELASRDLSGIERAVADERASSLYKSFAEERAPSIRPTD